MSKTVEAPGLCVSSPDLVTCLHYGDHKHKGICYLLFLIPENESQSQAFLASQVNLEYQIRSSTQCMIAAKAEVVKNTSWSWHAASKNMQSNDGP